MTLTGFKTLGALTRTPFLSTTTCTPTTPYTGAITVTSAETIEAIAVETGYVSSTVASNSYTLQTQLAAPIISPVSGAVPSGQSVSIKVDALGGAKFHCKVTAIGGATGALSPSSVITDDGVLSFNRTDDLAQGTHFAAAFGGRHRRLYGR